MSRASAPSSERCLHTRQDEPSAGGTSPRMPWRDPNQPPPSRVSGAGCGDTRPGCPGAALSLVQPPRLGVCIELAEMAVLTRLQQGIMLLAASDIWVKTLNYLAAIARWIFKQLRSAKNRQLSLSREFCQKAAVCCSLASNLR